MGEYDFANARIRGLRSRLIRPAEMNALARLPGLGELGIVLARSDFGPDLELARRRWSGARLLDEAFSENLHRRVCSVLAAFTAESGGEPTRASRLVGILVARYDLLNVVTVIRGRAAGVEPGLLRESLHPAGWLRREALDDLAGSLDLDHLRTSLRASGLPYLHDVPAPAKTDRGRWDVATSEQAIRRGFLAWAAAQLRDGDVNTAVVRAALSLEVDAANLLAVLRMLRHGVRLEQAPLDRLLLPGGSIPSQQLASLSGYTSPVQAVAALTVSPLARALVRTVALGTLFDETADLEWSMERFLARHARARLFVDPLGVALAMAYLSEKSSEVRSLRVIVRGVAAGWPVERMLRLVGSSL